jgi:hypothetical protein
MSFSIPIIPPSPGVPRERISDFPDVVYEELEKQVKPIDSELYSYMVNAPKDLYTLDLVVRSMISVGAYPYRKKIALMKKAFSESGQALSEISSFLYVDREYLPSSYGTSSLKMGDVVDPVDPDAPPVPPELMQEEIRRRIRWEKAWKEYIIEFRKRLPLDLGTRVDLTVFPCDLSSEVPIPRISPRLRLPTGDYLEPVVGTKRILPVSEDKKDEAMKFPWWIVAVVGAVALFFFVKD